MKSVFIFFIFLINCVSSPQPIVLPKENKIQPKYQIGDCLMIVDLPSGQTYSRHRIKIEKITDRYWYRWLLDNNKWDSNLSTIVGQFEKLEKISKKVNDCPVPVALRGNK